MMIRSGSLLMATGLLHEVVGIHECWPELVSMGRAGVWDSVVPASPMRMAVLWFLAFGLALLAVAALLLHVETTLQRPLPRSAGLWLLLLGVAVVLPMPRSGAWLLFPQALLVFVRAGRYRPQHVSSALGPMLREANHVDVRTMDTSGSLRGFAAAMLAYQPRWVTALYHVRRVLVRALGMKQDGVPHAATFSAATLPSAEGEKVGFFTVRMATSDVWAAEAEEKHLRATLAVVAAPGPIGLRPLHVVTIVHYKHWTGPVYFNLIRPFHHLVVGAMMRSVATGERGSHYQRHHR